MCESESPWQEMARRLGEMDYDELLEFAIKLHRHGHLLEATEIYERLFEAEPEHPDVLHFFALSSYQLGRHEQGLAMLRKAVVLAPEHADAHNNLGNMLMEQEQIKEAEEMYRRVIALRPDHANAHNNLGIILKRRNALTEATGEFRTAIKLSPDHAEAHHNLALVLERSGHYSEAATAAERAWRLKSQDTSILENLARTLRKAGRIDQAKRVAAQWRQVAPDSAVAQHMYAALGGEDTPVRATDDYVQDTFDHFAVDYDAVLKQLEYSGPNVVAELLAAHLPAAQRQYDILDAGCGTGLCAPALRDYARKLTGVDLSAGMLRKAATRSLYDQLIKAELTAFLQACPAQFDVIVMADTLPYIGAVSSTFAGISSCLRTDGLFMFTVEALVSPCAQAYRLEATGRYSHSQQYLEHELAAAGLKIKGVQNVMLRKECEKAVAGLAFVAHKDV